MLRFIDKGCHPNIEYIVKSVNFEYFIVNRSSLSLESKKYGPNTFVLFSFYSLKSTLAFSRLMDQTI